MAELTGFNREPHLFVGVAERNTFQNESVDFLYREHQAVAWIFQNMLVDAYLVHDLGSHLKAVFQFLEGWEEDFFDNLQVAEVAGWQVVHDHHDLLGQ